MLAPDTISISAPPADARHGYYNPFPVVRDVHKWFSGMARRHDWRTIASFAYIAVRK